MYYIYKLYFLQVVEEVGMHFGPESFWTSGSQFIQEITVRNAPCFFHVALPRAQTTVNIVENGQQHFLKTQDGLVS